MHIVSFVGGPAQGTKLRLHRAPTYLRIVITPAGRVDALDRVDDKPRPSESVHVYRQTSRSRLDVYVCGPPGGCHLESAAAYEPVEGVDGSALRGIIPWRAWVEQACGETLDCDGMPVPSPAGA